MCFWAETFWACHSEKRIGKDFLLFRVWYRLVLTEVYGLKKLIMMWLASDLCRIFKSLFCAHSARRNWQSLLFITIDSHNFVSGNFAKIQLVSPTFNHYVKEKKQSFLINYKVFYWETSSLEQKLKQNTW